MWIGLRPVADALFPWGFIDVYRPVKVKPLHLLPLNRNFCRPLYTEKPSLCHCASCLPLKKHFGEFGKLTVILNALSILEIKNSQPRRAPKNALSWGLFSKHMAFDARSLNACGRCQNRHLKASILHGFWWLSEFSNRSGWSTSRAELVASYGPDPLPHCLKLWLMFLGLRTPSVVSLWFYPRKFIRQLHVWFQWFQAVSLHFNSARLKEVFTERPSPTSVWCIVTCPPSVFLLFLFKGSLRSPEFVIHNMLVQPFTVPYLTWAHECLMNDAGLKPAVQGLGVPVSVRFDCGEPEKTLRTVWSVILFKYQDDP